MFIIYKNEIYNACHVLFLNLELLMGMFMYYNGGRERITIKKLKVGRIKVRKTNFIGYI